MKGLVVFMALVAAAAAAVPASMGGGPAGEIDLFQIGRGGGKNYQNYILFNNNLFCLIVGCAMYMSV